MNFIIWMLYFRNCNLQNQATFSSGLLENTTSELSLGNGTVSSDIEREFSLQFYPVIPGATYFVQVYDSICFTPGITWELVTFVAQSRPLIQVPTNSVSPPYYFPGWEYVSYFTSTIPQIANATLSALSLEFDAFPACQGGTECADCSWMQVASASNPTSLWLTNTTWFDYTANIPGDLSSGSWPQTPVPLRFDSSSDRIVMAIRSGFGGCNYTVSLLTAYNCDGCNGTGEVCNSTVGVCLCNSTFFHGTPPNCILTVCNASEVISCPVPFGTGSQHCDGGIWTECVATSCNKGYHLSDGECVSSLLLYFLIGVSCAAVALLVIVVILIVVLCLRKRSAYDRIQ